MTDLSGVGPRRVTARLALACLATLLLLPAAAGAAVPDPEQPPPEEGGEDDGSLLDLLLPGDGGETEPAPSEEAPAATESEPAPGEVDAQAGGAAQEVAPPPPAPPPPPPPAPASSGGARRSRGTAVAPATGTQEPSATGPAFAVPLPQVAQPFGKPAGATLLKPPHEIGFAFGVVSAGLDMAEVNRRGAALVLLLLMGAALRANPGRPTTASWWRGRSVRPPDQPEWAARSVRPW